MTTDLPKPMTAGDYDKLLQEVSAEYRGKGGVESTVSLAAMLGDYLSLAGILERDCGPLYYRKPKLRQRLQIMRQYEITEPPEHSSKYIEMLCDTLAFCIYRLDGGEMAPVTGDILQDVFDDADEVKKAGTQILGMVWDEEKGGSPEAAEPTTEGSSPS